jgi:hypothetical protein
MDSGPELVTNVKGTGVGVGTKSAVTFILEVIGTVQVVLVAGVVAHAPPQAMNDVPGCGISVRVTVGVLYVLEHGG